MGFWESSINAEMQAAASQVGTLWQILRPNYSNPATPETQINPSIAFRMDPGGKYVEPAIAGVEYYDVVGWRGLQIGDVLVPDLVTNPLLITLTVVSLGPEKPTSGIRTNKIGYITTGPDDGAGIIYSNVRFKFFNLPSVGDGLDSTILGSLGAAVRRVIIYPRNGILQGYWLRYSEQDHNGNNVNKALRIEAVDQKGYQLVLNVSDNPGK